MTSLWRFSSGGGVITFSTDKLTLVPSGEHNQSPRCNTLTLTSGGRDCAHVWVSYLASQVLERGFNRNSPRESGEQRGATNTHSHLNLRTYLKCILKWEISLNLAQMAAPYGLRMTSAVDLRRIYSHNRTEYRFTGEKCTLSLSV